MTVGRADRVPVGVFHLKLKGHYIPPVLGPEGRIGLQDSKTLPGGCRRLSVQIRTSQRRSTQGRPPGNECGNGGFLPPPLKSPLPCGGEKEKTETAPFAAH